MCVCVCVGGRGLPSCCHHPSLPPLGSWPADGSESGVQSDSGRGQRRLADQTICLGQTKLHAPVVIRYVMSPSFQHGVLV